VLVQHLPGLEDSKQFCRLEKKSNSGVAQHMVLRHQRRLGRPPIMQRSTIHILQKKKPLQCS